MAEKRIEVVRFTDEEQALITEWATRCILSGDYSDPPPSPDNFEVNFVK